jgi:hypothetical protein
MSPKGILNLREKEEANMSGLKCALQNFAVVSTLIVPIAANCQTFETVICNFTGSNGDGLDHLGALVAETSVLAGQVGAVYGVTAGGGSSTGVCARVGGCGTVFKLTPSGNGQTASTETLPFAEFVQSNGAVPAGKLFATIAGFAGPGFFGTTLYGGSTASACSGYGTVFSLVGNALATLWNFTGGDDGRSLSGALTADDAAGIPGAMYGTTRGFHHL